MHYKVINAEQVIYFHDFIIDSNELKGQAKDKSIEAVIERVTNRLQYGFISDVFDLAASYAVFIAKGHCFNDANKRTAAAVLDYILFSNHVEIKFSGIELGVWIVAVATNQKTEKELAEWLRKLFFQTSKA